MKLRRMIPAPMRPWLRRLAGRGAARVHWGSLRRTEPVCRDFGYTRGTPIDRSYIEPFLNSHAADIAGHVLEVKDSSYTRRFGGSRVTASEVVDIDRSNTRATIFADLNVDPLPAATFDCIIFTQTLQLLHDVPAVLRSLGRALKPGGVLLLTVPGITPIGRGALADTWFWAFTPASVRRLLGEAFPGCPTEVATHGNVLAATAFLQGLAAEELRAEELAATDLSYPVIITARVVRANA